MDLHGTQELFFSVVPWHRRDSLKLSFFDLALRETWQNALDQGYFLHGVESEPCRIPGRRGYVGVLCRNRASQKRKAQSFTQIIQKQVPNAFNFTKVKKGEVLMKTEMERIDEDRTTKNAVEDKLWCHFIINNSPYEYAHSLLVPELHRLQIQSITPQAIRLGIETLLKSTHPGFRVMYNSLCGGASVNHLHLHCYYTEYWLNSEAFGMIPLKHIHGTSDSNKGLTDCFELDFNDSCVRGFGFVITKENYRSILPKKIHKIVQYFVGKNIAHNIVIVRGVIPHTKYADESLQESQPNGIGNCDLESENIPLIENDKVPYGNVDKFVNSDLRTYSLVGRVYLFPRLPIQGEKCYRKFLVNVSELFGHLYFGDVEVFKSMDEDDIVAAFHKVSFSEKEFAKVKCDVVELLDDGSKC